MSDTSAARIYVGTDPTQSLGAKVFEYSVKKHSSIPVICDTMDDLRWPFPKDPANQPITNFSFNRFAIPKLAGYQGRAMYVDADMLVLRDLKEVWDIPFKDATVLYAMSADKKHIKQFSVMLLNCDVLRWDLDQIIIEGLDGGKYNYKQLMQELCIEPEKNVQPWIPPEWNSLEKYEPGKTGLIHYTDLSKQPWLNRKNPNVNLWVQYLKDAIDDGFVGRTEVEDAVKKGWARPSLLTQLDTPPSKWPFFLLTTAMMQDRGFQPHKELEARRELVKTAGTDSVSLPPAASTGAQNSADGK